MVDPVGHSRWGAIHKSEWLPIACSISAPLLVWALLDLHHDWDVSTFWAWGQVWPAKFELIYTIEPARPHPAYKYPVVGMLLTAGIFHSLYSRFPWMSTTELVSTFKLVLTLVDICNILLVASLLRWFAVPYARWLAFAIYLLPSTWAGAALWGQIDNYLLFFLLVSVRSFLGSKSFRSLTPLYYLAGIGAATAGLLTKQLFVFTLPGLCLLAVLRRPQPWWKWLLPLMTVSGGAITLDRLFVLPAQFKSHSAYLWLSGVSDVGTRISVNGFNVWMVLGWDMYSSALVPLIGALTLRRAGAALYVAFLALLAMSFKRWPSRLIMIRCLFFIALGQLGFNLLLTGTHERYLYLFYPFLFVVLAVLAREMRMPPVAWVLTTIGSVVYGMFVVAILVSSRWPQLRIIANHQIVGGYHLALSVFLLGLWLSPEARWRMSVRRPTIGRRP